MRRCARGNVASWLHNNDTISCIYRDRSDRRTGITSPARARDRRITSPTWAVRHRETNLGDFVALSVKPPLTRAPPEAVRRGVACELVTNRALWHARGRFSALRPLRAWRNPRSPESRGPLARRIGRSGVPQGAVCGQLAEAPPLNRGRRGPARRAGPSPPDG